MITIPAKRIRQLALSFLATSAFLTAACSDASTPTIPSTGPTMSRSLANNGGPRTFREEYRDLAKQVPGFAGVFLDSTGRLTVNFAPGSSDPVAVGKVVSWVQRVRPGLDAVNPRIREVPFSYSRLDSYYEPLFRVIGSMAFVTSSRIDDIQGRIVVTVSAIERERVVRDAALALHIPQAALSVEELAPIRRQATLRDQVRPVYGGLKIVNDFASICSLGMNGYHSDGAGGYDPSQPPVFMTASHCGGVNTVWGQNAVSLRIGQTIHDAPVFFPPSCGASECCPYPTYGCQDADVSVGEYDGGISQAYGVVYKTNLSSITIAGTYSVGASMYGAINGETVWKVGQTTGTTKGQVAQSCVDIPPDPPFPGVLCTQQANYASDFGDSGAPIFMPFDAAHPNSTPRIVGIHFGGGGYYSPINNIWAAQAYQFFW